MREMKDSGIAWVGSIPSHGCVHPVYFYFGERKNKNKFGQEDNLLSLSYGKIIRKDIRKHRTIELSKKTEKRPTTKGQTHSKICLRGKPQLSRQTGSVS